MSGKPVAKQTPLKCLDCEHEFDGFAMHKEHYVESGTVLARTSSIAPWSTAPIADHTRL